MSANICNICGANYKFEDGLWVCPACDHIKDDGLTNEETVILTNAYQKLRFGNFSESEELFLDIIEKYPKISDAYWGLFLSRNYIKYDKHLDEKAFPIFFKINNELISLEYVDSAINCASKKKKEYYQNQINNINFCINYWNNEITKQKPYDVVLSINDNVSQCLNNEVSSLYRNLVKKKYRVFLKRENTNKEQIELDLLTLFAINSCKAIIFFGESIEDFSSTYFKNNYQRYFAQIDGNEKNSDGALICYKNMKFSMLPQKLKMLQCFSLDSENSQETLIDFVRRNMLASSHTIPQLDRIKLNEYVPVAQSHKLIGQIDIKPLERSANIIVLSSNEKIDIVKKMIKDDSLHDKCQEMIDEILLEDPNNVQALVLKLFLSYNAFDEKSFVENVFVFEDYDLVENIFSQGDIDSSEKILDMLYDILQKLILSMPESDEEKKLIKFIIQYDYENREKNIRKLIVDSIDANKFNLFVLLIENFFCNDVLDYYHKYEKVLLDNCEFDKAKELFLKELSIDSQNKWANLGIISCDVKEESIYLYNEFTYKIVDIEENELLNYFSLLEQEELVDTISNILYTVNDFINFKNSDLKKYTEKFNADTINFYEKVLMCYPYEYLTHSINADKDIVVSLVNLSRLCVEAGFFDFSRKILNFLIVSNIESSEIYFLLMQANSECSSKQMMIESDYDFNMCEEKLKFFKFATNEEIEKFTKILEQQKSLIKAQKDIVGKLFLKKLFTFGFCCIFILLLIFLYYAVLGNTTGFVNGIEYKILITSVISLLFTLLIRR